MLLIHETFDLNFRMKHMAALFVLMLCRCHWWRCWHSKGMLENFCFSCSLLFCFSIKIPPCISAAESWHQEMYRDIKWRMKFLFWVEIGRQINQLFMIGLFKNFIFNQHNHLCEWLLYRQMVSPFLNVFKILMDGVFYDVSIHS